MSTEEKILVCWINTYLSEEISSLEEIFENDNIIELHDLLTYSSFPKFGEKDKHTRLPIFMSILLKNFPFINENILVSQEKDDIIILLKSMIYKFEIGVEIESGNAQFAELEKLAKKKLLNWAKVNAKGFYRIINFKISFFDGLAFCALVNKYTGKIDFDTLEESEDIEKQLKMGLDEMGLSGLIEDVFDIEDIFGVVVYVSRIRRAILDKDNPKVIKKKEKKIDEEKKEEVKEEDSEEEVLSPPFKKKQIIQEEQEKLMEVEPETNHPEDSQTNNIPEDVKLDDVNFSLNEKEEETNNENFNNDIFSGLLQNNVNEEENKKEDYLKMEQEIEPKQQEITKEIENPQSNEYNNTQIDQNFLKEQQNVINDFNPKPVKTQDNSENEIMKKKPYLVDEDKVIKENAKNDSLGELELLKLELEINEPKEKKSNNNNPTSTPGDSTLETGNDLILPSTKEKNEDNNENRGENIVNKKDDIEEIEIEYQDDLDDIISKGNDILEIEKNDSTYKKDIVFREIPPEVEPKNVKFLVESKIMSHEDAIEMLLLHKNNVQKAVDEFFKRGNISSVKKENNNNINKEKISSKKKKKDDLDFEKNKKKKMEEEKKKMNDPHYEVKKLLLTPPLPLCMPPKSQSNYVEVRYDNNAVNGNVGNKKIDRRELLAKQLFQKQQYLLNEKENSKVIINDPITKDNVNQFQQPMNQNRTNVTIPSNLNQTVPPRSNLPPPRTNKTIPSRMNQTIPPRSNFPIPPRLNQTIPPSNINTMMPNKNTINHPLPPKSYNQNLPSEEMVKFLVEAGVERHDALEALKKSNNDVQRAMNLLFPPEPKKVTKSNNPANNTMNNNNQQIYGNYPNPNLQKFGNQNPSGRMVNTVYGNYPNPQKNVNSGRMVNTVYGNYSNQNNTNSQRLSQTTYQQRNRNPNQMVQQSPSGYVPQMRKPVQEKKLTYDTDVLIESPFGGYIAANNNYFSEKNPVVISSTKTNWIFTKDYCITCSKNRNLVLCFRTGNHGDVVYMDRRNKNNKNQYWIIQKKVDGGLILKPYYYQQLCLDARKNQVVLQMFYNTNDVNQTWLIN